MAPIRALVERGLAALEDPEKPVNAAPGLAAAAGVFTVVPPPRVAPLRLTHRQEVLST